MVLDWHAQRVRPSISALIQAAWNEAIYAVIPIFGHILPAAHLATSARLLSISVMLERTR